MLKEDEAIKNSDKDILNRTNFAQNLASNIQNYFNKTPINNCLTIGLMGEWGSGKTSLLNMTEDYLKDSDIKIIKFNPWIYSSYNQLIEQFFDELIRGFRNPQDDSLKNLFEEYKFKINKFNLFKNILISGTSAINPILGDVTKETIKTDSDETNLGKIKKKIDKELGSHKVVCIIDDLDRLSKDEIAEMFKLIKIMADFKNMAYLVSFDKDVVANALKVDYGGEKYIEKIINVPLYVPLITTQELTNLLLDEVDRLKKQYNLEIDYSRLNNFINFYPVDLDKKFGVIYFFKNIRDINRFINILEFNIDLIKDEVNFADFFVLTALQIFHLDIYNKIKYNAYLLTNHHYYDGVAISKDKIIESKKEDFEKFCDNEHITLILKKLFPMMNYIYKPNHYMFHYSEFDNQLLICHPNHFKSYFKLDNIVKELPEKEVNTIISMVNSKESDEKIFNNLNNLVLNKLSLFLKYMLNRLDRITEKGYFIKILFLIDEKLGKEDYNYQYNSRNIKDLIVNLLCKIEKKYRFEILKENFELKNNMILSCDIWRFINENNLNPYVYDEEILSKKELNHLKDILKDKIKNISKMEPWNHSKFRDIMIICENFELIEVNNTIISNSDLNNEDILSFLKMFISEDKNSNSLKEDVIKIRKYCDINIVKNKINSLTQDYCEEQVVKNFLKGYDLINTE